MNFKMGMWDYIDTELPFNTTDRSLHMKDMGSKGWELVSVSSNPVSGCHIFFWKRPQLQDIYNAENKSISVKKKSEDRHVTIKAGKRQHETPLAPTTSKSNHKISEYDYKKFPEPQVVMVVKYRPKEGCFDQFRNELYTRDYPNVIERHMGFNE